MATSASSRMRERGTVSMERASAGMSVIVPERRLEYHLHQFPEAKMFERYTGQARECIFWARFEAARSGSSFIETEHLLLGVFEIDRGLADVLLVGSADAIAAIRAQAGVPERSEPEDPKKDLPLSHECKRVLAYGAEEGERMGARHIGTEHLVLGLLREQDCRA